MAGFDWLFTVLHYYFNRVYMIFFNSAADAAPHKIMQQ